MSRDLEQRLREAREALPLPSARATHEARESVVGAMLRRRRGRLRATAAVVVLAATTVVGVAAGLWVAPSGGASSPTGVTGLGFLPAKGWTIVQSAPGLPSKSSAVAASVPVHRDDFPIDGPPYRTIRTLPPDGVVIFAEFTARGNVFADVGYPTDDGVPQIDEAYRETLWSEQIRPEDPLAQYRMAFATGGYNVEVHVYAGRLHPTDQQIAGAQRQLDRMIVAGEPITLQVAPNVAAWGTAVTLRGSVTSGRADEGIELEERRCGSPTLTWTTVAGTHTEPGGGWELRWSAPITVTMRAVWRGNTSNVVTIRARPGVTIRQATRTRFLVDVRAVKNFEGKTAVLERFDRARGRFVAVKRFRLTDSGVAGISTVSTARVTASVPRGSLVRAVVPRTSVSPCYLAGYSNQLRTAK